MSKPYARPREHHDDQLARLALLLERQIVAAWEQGILPRIKDEFSGTFVSGQEVKALFAGGLGPSPEGERRLADLDAALEASGQHIEGRLAASREAGTPLPWDVLRSSLGLTATEEMTLWFLVGVDSSTRLRALARYLGNDSARIHVDVGLLEGCIYAAPATRDLALAELGPDGPLTRWRLMETAGRRSAEELPHLMRPLRVVPRVIELAQGRLALDAEVAEVADLLRGKPHQRVGAPELAATVKALLAASPGGHAPAALLLCGPRGSGRRSMVRQAADELGLGVLLVRAGALPDDREELGRLARALVREAVLHGLVPVIDDAELLTSAERPWRATVFERGLRGYQGPLVLTLAQDDATPPTLARGTVRINVPRPDEGERLELWRRALAETALSADLDLAALAARYPITGGVIERTAAGAIELARARGDGVRAADLHGALGELLDAGMSSLGVRVSLEQRWEDVVLPDDTMDGINEFVARLKHRRQVYEEWGFARKLGKGLGVSALFAGPPGTGKTMVAGLVARELGLDLYQIDLSRIVSKYVGETEKNLAALFEAAEAGHAVLLFDEADSLFAKRTEVKSSVDRYANLEVNYLLQRMERFSGVTVLTTNLESSIDAAFKRRLAFRIDFPFPEKEEREKLWRTLIPAEARVDGSLDFGLLSRKYEMAGGNVRNAVLRAAFLAAGAGSAINMTHLRRAADLEYASMGKVMSSGSL